jgi:hypothetical protein
MIRRIKRESSESKLLVEIRKENHDVLNSSSILSNSEASSSSNILSMYACKRTGAKSRRIRARH